jgi:glycosyltransferase involved in cell wall biosynthesis
MANIQDSNPIVASSRLREWWQPKAGNLLATIFLTVAWIGVPLSDMLWYFLPSVITIVGIGACGHVVNDLFDIKSDRQAGKRNRMSGFSPLGRVGVLLFFLAVALLPWLVLPWDMGSVYLMGAEFLLLIIYAIPPIRLKERALLGVFADGLYAYAIPSVLAAYTYFLIGQSEPDYPLLLLLFSWQWLLGIHGILIHQVSDYKNDLAVGANTFAVSVGMRSAVRLTQGVVLPLEIIFFLWLSGYVAWHLGWAYLVLPLAMMAWRYAPLLRSGSWKLYRQSAKPLDLEIAHLGYYKFMPFWNVLACILVNSYYLLFLPPILILLGDVPFLYQQTKFLYKKTKSLLHEALSHTVNWGIYYYRVHIKKENRRLALREFYDEQTFGKIPKRVQELTPIALVNRNADKYTETFVRRHLRELPFDTLFYFGADSYFPMYGFIGRLLPWRGWWLKILSYHEARMGLPDGFHRQKAWQRDLLRNNVRLVLAEFGTTGAAVAPACRDLGIPLVVIFHGYDAHNKDIVEEHKAGYEYMFKTADILIGVSQDIIGKLELIGAPKEKLRYLPCGINMDLFCYSNHRDRPPIFLCVGRFAETKSPHLSILAFHKVSQVLPEARLVMIGKKEDLYETCLILVKSLRLEQKVTFTGQLSPEEVSEHMRDARVFIQHSLTTPQHGDKEGTPVSIMEAMASGMAIVATRHAGIGEMISNEDTGLLVEEYDVNNMAAQMLTLALDDDLVEHLGRNASQSIYGHPLIRHNIKVLSDIINDSIVA